MRKKFIINGDADGIVIVLGKYLSDNGSISTELRERLCKAKELYDSGKAGKFLLSGGRANGAAPFSEADAMGIYLTGRGVPESDIIYERKSRNTFENARECAAILKSEEFSKLYLVSSAKHIYRLYYNPYRFFKLMFKLPVIVTPSTDCNVNVIKYFEGGKNCIVFYSSKKKLSEYVALHGDCNIIAKRKLGFFRNAFFPVSVGNGMGKRAERLITELEKIYGAASIVAVLK